jgi:hypothetical protein
LTIWFNAWLSGATSTDSALDGIVAGDAAHHVTDLPDDPEPVPLVLALGRMRNLGAVEGSLALPAPGDPLGLAGPTAFNEQTFEAGEGCVLSGSGLGVVPLMVGAGVFWRALPASCAPSPPDLAEADRELRDVLVRTADHLADLDLASSRPDVADELIDLRTPQTGTDWAPGYHPRAQAVAASALRASAIVSLAIGDGGLERGLMAPLDRVARRALVAACAPPTRA